MATYLSGALYQENNTAIFGTFRHFRGSYGTYANETAVKRILTFSRWYWSSHQPIIIETYYEAYAGTGYSKHLISGNTKWNGSVSAVSIVDGYDADSVTVSATQDLGSGDYPHWCYIQGGLLHLSIYSRVE